MRARRSSTVTFIGSTTILDRNLGLKLQRVDTDHLTLVDAAGATYVKNF